MMRVQACGIILDIDPVDGVYTCEPDAWGKGTLRSISTRMTSMTIMTMVDKASSNSDSDLNDMVFNACGILPYLDTEVR